MGTARVWADILVPPPLNLILFWRGREIKVKSADRGVRPTRLSPSGSWLLRMFFAPQQGRAQSTA